MTERPPAGKAQVWFQPEGEVRPGDGWAAFAVTAADLLDLEPRALFSERRRLERMGRRRLGLYLLARPTLHRALRWPLLGRLARRLAFGL